MLFDTAAQVVRTAAMGGMSYIALLVVLRISGKRTLAKLSAFDFVVTVALGSTLATILLSSEVSLAEGVAALTLLVAAQFVVAFVIARSDRARKLLASGPTVLIRDGQMRHDEMRRSRVSEESVRQAVRGSGLGGLELVAAATLESDGSISVVPTAKRGSGDALAGEHGGFTAAADG